MSQGADMPSCGKFDDAPHPVVMVLDQEITCAEATEIGKVLGKRGFTARFVSGTLADYGAKCAAYMRRHGVTWHQ